MELEQHQLVATEVLVELENSMIIATERKNITPEAAEAEAGPEPAGVAAVAAEMVVILVFQEKKILEAEEAVQEVHLFQQLVLPEGQEL